MVGAQAAGLIISTGLMYFVAKAGNGNQQRGWFLVMGGFAALATVCFLITGKMTRERVEPESKAAGEVKKDLGSILTNGPWLILFGASFFTIAAFNFRYGVAAYYFKYYADPKAIAGWSLYEGGAISAFFTLDKIAALISVMVFGAFAKKFEKKTMFIALLIASGLLSLGFNYVPNTNVTAIILIQALFSFMTAPTGAILFAMYTDIAAHIRNESGSASNGLVMSAGSFAQKFGWAIGGSLTGILLGWAGYVPDQTQSDKVKDIMSFMMSWAPMIACMIGAFFMAIYPLNDKRMRQITEELDTKGLKEAPST
jgi:GPH family glycoside/pentoside/hexuronide:cation symporter